MAVILAAAYPGLHTPSLRLPYLYANSGGLCIERTKEAINQTHQGNGLSIMPTHFCASKIELVKQSAREIGGGGKKKRTGLLRKSGELIDSSADHLVWGKTKQRGLVQIITQAALKLETSRLLA